MIAVVLLASLFTATPWAPSLVAAAAHLDRAGLLAIATHVHWTPLAATLADPQWSPLLWLVAAALVVAGIAGTVVPALPGAPLVFAGLLVAASIDDFQKVGWVTLTILAILALCHFVIDLWAARHGARRAGASRLALVGATLGSLVGLFFSLPGVLIGPFVGAFAGEYIARRDLRRASRAGFAAWFGLVLAAACNLALIFTMLALFAAVYLLHT